jgi:hypothetical protein
MSQNQRLKSRRYDPEFMDILGILATWSLLYASFYDHEKYPTGSSCEIVQSRNKSDSVRFETATKFVDGDMFGEVASIDVLEKAARQCANPTPNPRGCWCVPREYRRHRRRAPITSGHGRPKPEKG